MSMKTREITSFNNALYITTATPHADNTRLESKGEACTALKPTRNFRIVMWSYQLE